jgi:hypothetical protein
VSPGTEAPSKMGYGSEAVYMSSNFAIGVTVFRGFREVILKMESRSAVGKSGPDGDRDYVSAGISERAPSARPRCRLGGLDLGRRDRRRERRRL